MLQLLGIILVGLLLAMVALVLMEKGLIFYPEPQPREGTWEPANYLVEHVTFTTADGVELHAWWREAEGRTPPEEQPVLIFCHGNAGNISSIDRGELLTMLASAGLNVLLFDYRGYGASEGEPDEDGLYLDGEAAYDYLVQERGIDPCRLFAFGRSLGASVALHIALNREVQGVILDGAFASIPRMAALHPLLKPFTFLIRNRFNNVEKAPKLTDPLLMIHGSNDEIVPISQARDVRDAAVNAKQRSLWPVPDAKHNDTFYVAPNRYKERVMQFCRAHMNCDEE
jgi:fermentation-respiration switch protein FrsA (DUF1100 family)